MISATFIFIFWLKGKENNVKNNLKTTQTVIYTTIIGITVAIKVACAIVEIVTPFLVNFERPETYTNRNIGMIWRSSISVFLNSVLVVTLANIYYMEDRLDDTFYTDKGLANDLLFLLIFGCLEAIFAICPPRFLVTLVLRYWLKAKGIKSMTPQYRANEIYEPSPWVYPKRFGKYCNTLLITFFIVSIFPYAPLIAIANILLFLCADRFFLMRLSKIPEYCSSYLALSMLRFSDMIFVSWAAGYMVLEIITLHKVSVWSISIMSAAGFNLIFNPNTLLRKLFSFTDDEAAQAKTDLKEFLDTMSKPETYRLKTQ